MSHQLGVLSDEVPGYQTVLKTLREHDAIRISQGLLFCAGFCLVRAAIVPWYLHFTGSMGKGLSDLEIVATSLILSSLFVVASVLARFLPLIAVLISGIGFVAICVRDYLSYPDILAQGLVFKTILMVLWLRHLFTALISRIL
ncbi:MAG: hypothetical protein KatS3mg104_0430 [Phycisphaerae bacterium]|jgi:hypothetical protein|nr:MAG: hypothetical protein KatS3mg104_0430 [Phycisphaerae bacterium]